MLTSEFYYGQGLGNQLFVYVTTRAIAESKNYDFGFTGVENLGDKRYNNDGLYFLDLDLGKPVDQSKIQNYYKEKETRLKINTCHHDNTIGCDIRLTDWDLINVPDNTKIDGVMQSEDYFYHKKHEIREWLKVKEDYDCKDFMQDDVCVLNIRDNSGSPELFLPREYWMNAIHHMLRLNPNMQFLVITESPERIKNFLPELAENTYHFDIAKDYSIIKNAKWLVMSNTTFSYFPAITNEVANLIIAPKYWLRHNVSNGFWSCGYNLYRDFVYLDRAGNLQTYDECFREFELFKQENKHLYQ